MFPEYGDVVLLRGTGLINDKVIGWLTECKYHHSGLFTDNLRMDVMTRRGVVSNHLIEDMKVEGYGEYVIMRHADMTSSVREKVKRINEEKFRDLDYDEENINRLAKKLLLRKIGLDELDDEDISNGGLYCHSRISKIYLEAGLNFAEEIDSSQIIAPHFMRWPFMPVVYGDQKGIRHYLH
jgi:hypothetical protein